MITSHRVYAKTEAAFKRYGIKTQDVLIHGVGPVTYGVLVRDEEGKIVHDGRDGLEIRQVEYPNAEAAKEIYELWLADDLEYMALMEQD